MTVIKNDEAKDKKGLIDYNCHIFQDALNAVFARAWEKEKANENGENGENGEHGEQQSGKTPAQDQLEAQLES